jgi:hypothetical protein
MRLTVHAPWDHEAARDRRAHRRIIQGAGAAVDMHGGVVAGVRNPDAWYDLTSCYAT